MHSLVFLFSKTLKSVMITLDFTISDSVFYSIKMIVYQLIEGINSILPQFIKL